MSIFDSSPKKLARRKSALGQVCASLALLSTLLLCISGIAMGQASSGTLNGVVRDSSGAVIQHASVVLSNLATSAKKETTTNDSGVYSFINISPGDYTLTVTKEGFAPQSQQNLRVLVNSSSSQDFTLNPGSTTAEVVVQASAIELNTSDAAIGNVVEAKQTNDLPLNGRNFTQLMTLVAGVAPVNTGQSGNGGGQSNPLGANVAPSINGQQVRSNYYLLDGIDNTEMNYGVPSIPPVIDDIQEFKVQGHNDEAQFGGVVGGVINVVTKSGSNQFRGTAWEYLRNTIFDANNPISQVPQKLVKNQFGVNAGGPVYIPHLYDGRNKSFVFGSYEGVRIAAPQAGATYMVPTSAQLAGDFSAICPEGFDGTGLCNNPAHQLYNPFSDPANRTPFANNNIASAINPQALAFVKSYFPAPLALQTNGANGQVFNGIDPRSLHTTQNQYSIRGDQNFNASNTAFFRYSTMNQPNLGPGANNSNYTDNRTVSATQWASSFVHTFGSSSVADFEFGHVNLTNSSLQNINGDAQSVITSAGFAQSFACGFTGGASNCAIPNIAGLSTVNNLPNSAGFAGGGQNQSTTLLSDVYQWRGNFTKTLQKHAFSTGFSWENDRFHVINTSNTLTVSNAQTASVQNPNAGNSLASMLLGTIVNGGIRDTVAPLSGQRGAGFYFMDKWKLSDRLTVNLGMRVDLQFNGVYGDAKSGTIYVGNVDFNNGTYVLQQAPGSCDTLLVAPCIPGGTLPANVLVSKNGHLFDNNVGWEPRIGVAYRLSDHTVVRGGFGVFNDLWGGVSQRIQNIGGTWPTTGQIVGPAGNDLNSVATVDFQNPLAVLGNANLPAASPFTNQQWYQDPHNKTPYSEQWNFGVEQRFGPATVVTANYVGSQTHDLIVGGLYNVATTPVPGGTLAEVEAKQPYPYINPTFWDHSVGNANYNALQVSANRRASNGLSYIVSYTYSKAMNLGCDGFFGGEGCSVPNPYNLSGDRSVAGTDLTHVFTAGITAESPVGKNKAFSTHNSVADYLIGNWQLNTIISLTSGQPYTVNMANSETTLATDINHNVPWDNFNRPDLVGDPNSGTCPNGSPVHTVSCWFNPSAFAVPGQDSFGNAPRNFLRADAYSNVDLSVFRLFPLGEKRSLQFRAEAFNLFNHPTWGTPGISTNGVGGGNNTLGGGGFGAITGTRSIERQLQFALKLYF